ncbi:18312_t:CDS:2 [Dentiscutata erythropus]|uniref:18312_t:CDS:1 n=1 Tax=Dentiscutata erythropus TaxID=1348616 RepID=A0A9N9AEK8_9GLOM|nr:18312_t:CDS:2 [Dentiscutata erythropus]
MHSIYQAYQPNHAPLLSGIIFQNVTYTKGNESVRLLQHPITSLEEKVESSGPTYRVRRTDFLVL